MPFYAEKVANFEMMTSKNAKFEWTSAHREAFARIKDEIASAGMRHNLDYKLPIIVRTDASTRGVGAVLCQRDGNRWRNVALVSKRFTGTATRWSTIDQESFAIFCLEELEDSFAGTQMHC